MLWFCQITTVKMTWTTTSASTTVSPAAVSLRLSCSRSNAAALSDLTLWCWCCYLRYGDSRPGACHHHGSHRRASAQQPQPPPLLVGECWRGDVLPNVPAHWQSGERGLQRHAVPQQLQPATAQHQQPHPGLQHGLQLHGPWGLHVYRLQRPALLPPTLQQPSGARLSAAGESQHRGAGAAVLPLRGLLPRTEGPWPSQLKTTQSHRFDQSEPRAGTQGQYLQQEKPGESGGAALQTPHQLAGNWGFSGREVQDDGAGRRPGQPSVRDVSPPPGTSQDWWGQWVGGGEVTGTSSLCIFVLLGLTTDQCGTKMSAANAATMSTRTCFWGSTF